MRRVLQFLIPIVIVLVLLLVLWFLHRSNVIEISSEDDRIRLVIPKDALVAESDADSIRITALDPATMTPAPGVPHPLFGYRLEPEGLAFKKPVQLIVDPGFWGPRQLPVLFHYTTTELEALQLEVTVVNARVASVKTQLSHFSEVLGSLSILALDIDDPGDQHLQSPFYVRASVSARPAELNKLEGDPNGIWSRQRVQGPVQLSAGAYSATGTLAPVTLADKPASADMELTAGHSELESFECTAESTGNSISYTVQTAFKLLLSDSFNPARVVEVPIKDTLKVQSNAFACLAAEPLPSVDYFDSTREVLDSKGEDYFEADISKRPGGSILVGSDFMLKAEVRHVYDGPGATAIGPSWDLRYGQFEYVMITNNAISPLRVGDVPWLAVVSAEGGWHDEARFRCMNAGSALIEYKAFVYAKSPDAKVNGVLGFPIHAQASVECIGGAGAQPPGSFAALPESDRIGPFDAQVFDELNGFQTRWWREPADDRLYIGTPVKVHVEVENLRAPAAGTPGAWGLAGNLYTTAGSGLEPREYPQAPAPGVTIPFRGVWSADYAFTCRKADVAFLRQDFSLLPPSSPNDPPLRVSVFDPGLKCVGD